MPEASLQWKAEILRQILDASHGCCVAPRPETDERAWFIDMEKDGFIQGTWGTQIDEKELSAGHIPLFPIGGKTVFSSLHVTEKGKKLVLDYERRQQDSKAFDQLEPNQLITWNDKKLAEWQSNYKSDQAQWVLAEHEWRRRSGASSRKIAIAAICVSVLSLLIAALGYIHSIWLTDSKPAKLIESPAPQLPAPAPAQK